MSITLISHIFNEEYYLPFWLEYHSKIFTNAIIIDYCSTDNSVKIIESFCPHWKIIKTKNVTSDGKPFFDAVLVDKEVVEIENTIDGFKIAMNTTEWLLFNNRKKISKYFKKNHANYIRSYPVTCENVTFYPKNTIELLENITLINRFHDRSIRILHDYNNMPYWPGRHGAILGNQQINRIDENNVVILWFGFYPINTEIIKRKSQIQKNVPNTDIIQNKGSQHITNETKIVLDHKKEIEESENIFLEKNKNIVKMIFNAINMLKGNNIYYSELYPNSEWGDDKILLDEDINLLKKTNFDDIGYKVVAVKNINTILQDFLISKIKEITNKTIQLELYHDQITETEHTSILNRMPFKKSELFDFSEYVINVVSTELSEELKIFNDDIWFRICRPSNKTTTDNNPCHRDIYLDFYRNTVNIYYPVCGSNEFSSLLLEQGSHKWNENETRITNGGTNFKYINKKYSVDAIVSSKQTLNMIRPNPNSNELLIFSPYLIHGCSSNNNPDVTRISVEIRFIKNDDASQMQETAFTDFLKNRNWR